MGFLWVTITQKINRVVIIQHGLICSFCERGEGESPLEEVGVVAPVTAGFYGFLLPFSM